MKTATQFQSESQFSKEKDIMVQQTAVRKAGRRLKFLDTLLVNQGDGGDLKRDIDFLIKDHTMFTELAADLSSHSKWIPYPFLIERLKKIADELRGFAEILRGKIIESGGQISQESSRLVDGHGESAGHGSSERYSSHKLEFSSGHELFRQNVGLLVRDMEDHSSSCDVLQHQRNQIKDSAIAKLINLIIVDMQRQRNELIDIVMRIS
jgi:hypothetical protein